MNPKQVDAAGGPAFPAVWNRNETVQLITGITALDWFAGQALAGILAHDKDDDFDNDLVAQNAYKFAAAMLAERARRAGEGASTPAFRMDILRGADLPMFGMEDLRRLLSACRTVLSFLEHQEFAGKAALIDALNCFREIR